VHTQTEAVLAQVAAVLTTKCSIADKRQQLGCRVGATR
jgi:hypothetical protein